MTTNISLDRLLVYPLKSAAARELGACTLEPRGLADDRRWMVVDAHGNFVTGRNHAAMVLIRAEPRADGIALDAPGVEGIEVSRELLTRQVQVKVWKDMVDALGGCDAADAWISRVLGIDARIVWMPESSHRAVDPAYAHPDDIVSFADAYPLLLIPSSSLAALNAALETPVDMLQFRPNLVIEGSDAFAEHGWRRLRIGEIEFDVAKPCTRCIFTTVDPTIGRRSLDGEPLKTLTRLRRIDGRVVFGMNLIPRKAGRLQVGDPVEIIETL